MRIFARLAEEFEQLRPQLFAIAYRMTGFGHWLPEPQLTDARGGEHMALQSATTPRRRAARPADPADPLLIGTVSACGLLMLVAGAWALASPSTFADVVGFDRAGEHFLHDAGAFQLGIGAGLILALIWRDPLTVVLTGFLIANTAHAVNHATDLHLGGRRADAWLLAGLSLVVAAALLRRLRRGGWVVGSVCAATDPALAPFETQKTVVVATFRRSGEGVATPVSLAVAGDRAVFRTFARSGKTGPAAPRSARPGRALDRPGSRRRTEHPGSRQASGRARGRGGSAAAAAQVPAAAWRSRPARAPADALAPRTDRPLRGHRGPHATGVTPHGTHPRGAAHIAGGVCGLVGVCAADA